VFNFLKSLLRTRITKISTESGTVYTIIGKEILKNGRAFIKEATVIGIGEDGNPHRLSEIAVGDELIPSSNAGPLYKTTRIKEIK